MAASRGDHPAASGPSSIRATSSGVMPASRGQYDVLLPLVDRLPDRGYPEDEHLALAGRERRGKKDVAVERVEGLRQGGVVGQHPEHIQALRASGFPTRHRMAGSSAVGSRRAPRGSRQAIRPGVGG